MNNGQTKVGVGRGRPGRSRRRVLGAGSLVTLVAVFSLAASACGSSSTATSQTSVPKTNKTPFVIGALFDQTGTNSTINVPQYNGLKAWVQVVDATGGIDGHPVKLQSCDTQSSITVSLTCAQKMGNVGMVVDDTVTGEMNADVPILNGLGKVVMTINPTLNPPFGSNLFQASPSLSAGSKVIFGTAKKAGISTVGVITTDDVSGVDILGAAEEGAQASGLQIASQKISATTVDATVQVEKLAAQHVGLIYDAVPGSAATVVLHAINTLGIKTPVMVQAAEVNPDFLSVTSSYIPGQVYGVPFSDLEVPALLTGQSATGVKKFEKEYQQVTGHALDLTQTDLSVPITAQAETDVMLALGPTPALVAAQNYIRTHVLPGIAPLEWAATGIQVVTNVPVSLAEAKTGDKLWGKCIPRPVLPC